MVGSSAEIATHHFAKRSLKRRLYRTLPFQRSNIAIGQQITLPFSRSAAVL